MANAWIIQGQTVSPQGIDEVSTTQNFPFGTKREAKHATYGEATFIYVKGVSSGAEGAWVTYDPGTGTTALLTANAKGNVGIMMSALDAATDFGWIMVLGKGSSVASTVSIADNADLYATATGGTIGSTVVTGDRVWNAKAGEASSDGTLLAEISWPFVTDAVNSGTS